MNSSMHPNSNQTSGANEKQLQSPQRSEPFKRGAGGASKQASEHGLALNR